MAINFSNYTNEELESQDLFVNMTGQKQEENKRRQQATYNEGMPVKDRVKYSEEGGKVARNVKNNSRKENVKPVSTSKKQKPSKKRNHSSVKNFVIGLLVGAALTTAVAVKIAPNVNDSKDLDRATEILEEAAINKLAENDLGTYDENGEFVLNGRNTADDYKKLDIDTDLEVYIYREIADKHWNREAGDKNQFDSIIGASLSSDDYSYHTDFDHFLSDNGYFSTTEVNEDGGLSTSPTVFKKYMESEILDLYRNGTVSEYAKEAFGDYNTKGGITK